MQLFSAEQYSVDLCSATQCSSEQCSVVFVVAVQYRELLFSTCTNSAPSNPSTLS